MKYIFLAVLFLTFGVLFYMNSSLYLQQLCDVDSCPVCYGNDLCKDFFENKILLHYDSLQEYINNILSVKNVYFALFGSKRVVLKKLAHNSELRTLQEVAVSGSYEDIKDFLVCDGVEKHFKICDIDSVELFLQKLNFRDIRNLQTILRVNIEPILLQMLDADAGWCVPKLYGYCGRLVVIENSGYPISHVEDYNWFDRAYFAFQILQAAYNFTENDNDFRFYLTDISPDNIAVNENMKISFIDLEHVIIKKKTLKGAIHQTEHFDTDSYIYSEKKICESSISDHNIYAVCRLLLSKTAIWPMMKNGLLHSPPPEILESYGEIFINIEMCVHPEMHMDRFVLSTKILKNLKTLLMEFTNYTQ